MRNPTANFVKASFLFDFSKLVRVCLQKHAKGDGVFFLMTIQKNSFQKRLKVDDVDKDKR